MSTLPQLRLEISWLAVREGLAEVAEAGSVRWVVFRLWLGAIPALQPAQVGRLHGVRVRRSEGLGCLHLCELLLVFDGRDASEDFLGDGVKVVGD